MLVCSVVQAVAEVIFVAIHNDLGGTEVEGGEQLLELRPEA
jgi:hypothetical protein